MNFLSMLFGDVYKLPPFLMVIKKKALKGYLLMSPEK
jgi:hypothetical protein